MSVRILQFGEGNFLRAFIDWMVQGMNEKVGFDGQVLLAKTIPGPFFPAFERQGHAYHLVIRGKDGERVINDRTRIGCISGTVNAYEDWDGYLAAARNPDLKVVVSNTTEAGIAMVLTDKATDRPASSYPGKLTQFLRARFEAFGPGPAGAMCMMPCELIEKNGQTLKKYVLEHAARWYGDAAFNAWLDKDCTWFDTLVDRIVPGHDKEERARCLAETGSDDELLVVTEPYHIFVIQGKEREDILPFRKAGFNVVWTDDLTPYRTLKVRILNGGHTFMAMVGLGLGIATVRESLEHPLMARALDEFYGRDVLPLMPFEDEVLARYKATILDRFANPFVVHKLGDIALNSVSKYISRILPGVNEYVDRFGTAPELASFGLAALLNRYLFDGDVKDDAPILEKFRSIAAAWSTDTIRMAQEALKAPEIWIQGAKLPAVLVQRSTEHYAAIRAKGMGPALEAVLKGL